MFVRVGAGWFFNPLDDVTLELQKLVRYYLRGMLEPIRFFPKTSMRYAERFKRSNRHDEALRAARNEWEGSDFSRWEKDDPYYKLCFNRVDPLDSTFTLIASDVFKPLFNKREKVSTSKK
jgi:exodeoxyribonuclease V gamma subunit